MTSDPRRETVFAECARLEAELAALPDDDLSSRGELAESLALWQQEKESYELLDAENWLTAERDVLCELREQLKSDLAGLSAAEQELIRAEAQETNLRARYSIAAERVEWLRDLIENKSARIAGLQTAVLKAEQDFSSAMKRLETK